MRNISFMSLRGRSPKQSPARREIATSAFGFLAMTIILTSCLPLDVALPTEPPIPTDTPLQTPTIVWFPPTATPTHPFFPTTSPIPEMNPGIGAVTLTDNFSKASAWDTASSNDGSASISGNRLSLAVQPGIYLLSQRHDLVLGDFYAEITANLSLCRGDDGYGVVVRSAGRSYYRFILSCNGQAGAERVNTHGVIPLHDPMPSADVPRGAPGNVTIGVWAVGSELRLFLNGRYQFGFSDTSYASGGIGVYALSQGTDPVSVTFSDLKVYEVDYTLPTKTPKP
jgi:hypothetical protein